MSALRKFFIFIFVAWSPLALAQSVVLRNAKEAAVKIAIQEFVKASPAPEVSKLAVDLESTLTADLIFSRIFKVLPSDAFLEQTITGPINILKVTSWRQLGAQYVVRARVNVEGNESVLQGYVFDVLTGKLVLEHTYRTRRSEKDILAHEFGDDIVEIVTGQKGLFSTKIAFAYVPPGVRNKKIKEIWMVDFNGRHSVPLVRNGRSNLSPQWTIDGRFIYFTSSSLIDWNIWKTDLSGKTNQVTRLHGSALGPKMLPNGREMVISSSKDGNTDLYLMTLAGKEVKRLTASRGMNISASISPDGKKLCFSSDRWGNLHVAALDIATLDVTRLTRVGTLNDTCAWNPTENLVIFSGMDTDREFDVFAMDDQGNNMERLTYDATKNEHPSWSPDGKLITFASQRSGRSQIYVMKADGTEVTPIIDLPGDASQPSWSPRLGY